MKIHFCKYCWEMQMKILASAWAFGKNWLIEVE